MNKTLWIIAVLVIVATVFLVKSSGPNTTGPVKIGVIGPFSGILADFGEEVRRGVVTAQNEKVEFVFEDDECEPAPAVSAFKKLTEIDKVQYVIGPLCGSPQEAVAPLAKTQDVLVLLPSAASRNLFEASGRKIYQIQYSLEDESKFIAQKMSELGHEKVVLISFQNAFSEVHVKTFKENFKGQIVSELSFPGETTDVASELVKIRNTNADAVFVTDISFFFAQGVERLKQYNIKIPVFSQYAVELPAVRSMVEGVIYSFPADVGEKGAIFELSKLSAEKLVGSITECGGKYGCTKKTFQDSPEFSGDGVREQSIVLKQIINGEAVMYKK